LSTSVKYALASSFVTPTGEDIVPLSTNVEIPKVIGGVRVNTPPVSMPRNHTFDDLSMFRSALESRQQEREAFQSTNLSVEEVPSNEDTGGLLDGAVVLAQARNMYIVAHAPAGLLLIDQHVAHERILHDRLSGVGTDVQTQRLVVPITLDLGKRESLVMENKLQDLSSLGFEIEPFGKEAFVVRAVPVVIAGKNCEQILRDTIEELTELTLARRLIVHRDAIITTTSCKMAIKAGERLSFEEMQKLVSELRQTSNPYLCPHGRPIVVCFSNRDLDKLFGRA